MGYTIAEKILARCAGKESVRSGDDIMAKPDFVLAYDFAGYTDVYFRLMKEEFGIARVTEPDRFAIFIDHMLENQSAKEAALHKETRDWCAANGVQLFEKRGIGHQVAVEEGFASPGAFIVHFDGHVSQLGAYGALAIGLRRGVFEAFVSETVAIRVPETTRVNLRGALAKGVMGRDLFHYLVHKLGPAGCRFQVLELGGVGIANLSDDGLQAITGMAMFTGAITSIVDQEKGRLDEALRRARKQLSRVFSDPDASYAAVHDVDLASVSPQIVVPPTPAVTRELSEFTGTKIDVGYLGSCVSGRLEDIAIAARIVRGRRVHPGFSLHVVPSSNEIMEAARAAGYLHDLEQAGAKLSAPTCDHCYGHLPLLAGEQRAVSTATLNVKGRMGSVNSEIFLCSAATVAATALEGAIADPRLYMGVE